MKKFKYDRIKDEYITYINTPQVEKENKKGVSLILNFSHIM